MNARELLTELSRQGVNLWVDGDQLRCKAPKGVMTAELHSKLAESKTELMRLLSQGEVGDTTLSPSVPTELPSLLPDLARQYEPFPTTDVQQAYWIGRGTAFELGGVGNHIYIEVEARNLDLARSLRILRRLIQRHPMLRAILLPDGRQQILEQVPAFSIESVDLSGLTEPEVAEQLAQIRRKMDHHVFPVEQWPAFQIRISRFNAQSVRVHASIESLFVDTWSIRLLIQEFLHLYQEPEASLPPLECSFRDYVLAEAKLQESARYRRSRDYWAQRLSNLPLAPELPLAIHPGMLEPPHFVSREARLEAGLWQRLKARGRQAGLTPSGVLLAAFAGVLATWSKTPRFCLNLTTFDRLPLHPCVDEIVGDFTSLLLLTVDHSLPQTFEQRAKQLQEQFWRDFDHHYYSGVRVLRDLAQSRGDAAQARMPVVFTSLLTQETPAVYPTPWQETIYCVTQTPQVWLDHQVREEAGDLLLYWQAVEALFPPGLLDAMFGAYTHFLERLATDEKAWQSDSCELIPASQLAQYARFNATEAKVSDRLLQSFFLEQAASKPEQVAVIALERTLTYQQVKSGAMQLGQQLRQLGARPNQLVAVVMEKGWEQVVGVLGVLLSGAAYLPIDPKFPLERLAFLLEHGDVEVVLTQSWVKERIPWPKGVKCICVDHLDLDKGGICELAAVQKPDDLAYVIYTSGSTGVPKGVMIDHRGAVNTILDINRRFGIGSTDRVLALSALHFDLSVYDIFGLLAAGGTLVFPDEQKLRDPAFWLQMIDQEQITLWNTVPALAQMLVEYAETRAHRPAGLVSQTTQLRLALLSGDWIPLTLPQRLKDLFPSLEVISLGGATEASIWSILYPITSLDPSWKSIPYGRPMENQQWFILNNALEACPVWVPGHLYIGGIGLAKGYWRDEEKTRASFIEHPRTGKRLYRTGDLGRYLPDGAIEFLGREDFQVKIRGHRIELGEIEAALGAHPRIRHAIVSAVGSQFENKRLIAYVVPQGERTASSYQGEDRSASLVDWERLVATCQTSQETLAEPMVDETFLQVWQTFEHIALHILCHTWRDFGVFGTAGEHYSVDALIERCGIHPRYTKWVQRNLRVLVQNGQAIAVHFREQDGVFSCEQPLPAMAVSQLWSLYQSATAQLTAPMLHALGWKDDTLPLLPFRRVGHLKRVLTEELHSAEIYVSSEMLELYHLFLSGSLLMRIIVEEVLRQAKPEKKIRILEIGAGFGVVTVHLLPLLEASSTEYVYTDISTYFLQEAQEKFAPYSNVSYGLLDIEQDPQLQGYPAHAFDLVIAASVLHATAHLAETLRHVRHLLKPHGLLLLLEGTHFHTLLDLTMGLQQGIDRFEDTDLRPSHPLLSREQWQEVLREQGFVSSVIFNKAGTLSDFLGIDVLLAQAPSNMDPLPLEQLEEHLRSKLPEYMLPASIVQLERLPLTANGKVDRSALPNPLRQPSERREACQSRGSVAARTPTEQTLVDLWSDILQLKHVGLEENFWQVGGDSLLATKLLVRIRAQFQIELPFQAIFTNSTIAQLSKEIEQQQLQQSEQVRAKLVPQKRPEAIPLSFAQQRLWFLSQFLKDSSAYLYPFVWRLSGALSVQALDESLVALVARHESLRTTFVERMGQPMQVIHPPGGSVLLWIDLQGLKAERREGVALWLGEQGIQTPCDLMNGPLMRTSLLRLDVQEHALLFLVHHLVGDAWSGSLIMRELAALYNARIHGKPTPLSPLPIQYADYAIWQREWLSGVVEDGQLAYWKRQLAGAPLMNLPTDYPRSAVPTFVGAHQSRVISPELLQQLNVLSHKHGVTLFMTLLSAFSLLLHSYTGQEDLVIGTDVANRNRIETEGLIGFFVNQLALRVSLSNNPRFLDVLSRVQKVCTEAYAHQDLPFERLVEVLNPQRDLSRTPLFQVKLLLEQEPVSPDFGGLLVDPLEWPFGTPEFDLILHLSERNQKLLARLEYRTDLFEAETITRLLANFQIVIEGVVQDPQAHLCDLPRLSDAERNLLLVEWNATTCDFPQDLSLPQIFEQQVEHTPETVAVLFEEQHLTYGALFERTNQLAHALQQMGVGPEHLVGILLERSLELVIALLATLKAGGAFLPFEPAAPSARLQIMLREAQPTVVLTSSQLLSRLPASMDPISSLCLDTDWSYLAQALTQAPLTSLAPEHLAYLIYTSGSTGRPKGVMNTHRGLLNRLLWMQDAYALTAGDRVLQKTPVSFDVSVWEFFWPLCTGASLVLARPGGQQDPGYLRTVIQEAAITTLHFVPSMLHAFLQEPDLVACGSLRQVMSSGEALTLELQARFFARLPQGVHLYNLYGPTEAAIDVTAWTCQREAESRSVPIGRPIANTQIYVLDAQMRAMPRGAVGELSIGGVGLARGYYGQAGLTAERFVPNPFSQQGGSRLYRTGDLACYRADGQLEYRGRIDQQVKLRGYRIELGEIEATLLRHQGVDEAVVVTREDTPGEKQLVAYVVAGERELPETGGGLASTFRGYCREHLPDYMVPAFFVQLEALPLTSSGKVDWHALPAPESSVLEPPHEATLQTPVEELVLAIYREVLPTKQIGLHESFFDLGGHSLLAVQVISRLRAAMGVELSVRSLFETPTPAGLARQVEQQLRAGNERSMPPPAAMARGQDLPLSFAQQRLWFQEQMVSDRSTYVFPLWLRLRGVLQVSVLEKCLREIIRRHESLRTTFVASSGQPIQIIHADVDVHLPVIDLRVGDEEKQRELFHRLERGLYQPFDLSQGPLMRMGLLRLQKQEHLFYIVLHHIIFDAWSTSIFFRELSLLYEAILARKPSPLPPLALQYVDVALWQRERLKGEVLDTLIRYWTKQLAGAVPVQLPTDRPRSALVSNRGAVYPFTLPVHLWQQLTALSREIGVTLFMTLLTAFQIVLSRTTGQDDIVVGTDSANRTEVSTEQIIGFFVNLLVLRVQISAQATFREIVKRVCATVLEAYAHQDLPFERLVDALQFERNPAQVPGVNVLFVLNNVPQQTLAFPGLTVSEVESEVQTAKFDVALFLMELDQKIAGYVNYRTDLFDARTIASLVHHFEVLLHSIVTAPDSPVEMLEMFTKQEREQGKDKEMRLLTTLCAPTHPLPAVDLHQLFEEQAKLSPQQLAVISQGEQLTYQQLNERANRLAQVLRKRGVGPNGVVGLCMVRSAQMLVGLLAILKAGGAYLPLETDSPPARLASQLQESQAVLLLTQQKVKSRQVLSGLSEWTGSILELEDLEQEMSLASVADVSASSGAEDLAYIVYTSGSTGRPKGVMIRHASVVNYTLALCEQLGAEAGWHYATVSTLAADLGNTPIFCALLSGGCVQVLDYETVTSADALTRWGEQHPIDVLKIVPSHLSALLAGEDSKALLPSRALVLGGEVLPTGLLERVRRLGGSCKVYNHYGPTETTIGVLVNPLGGLGTTLDEYKQTGTTVPLGRPITNTELYILDQCMQVVPVGVTGELYIAGVGLAMGYVGQEEQTAERFVPHPYGRQPGRRLYRTGDLVRFDEQENLEFIGRRDRQVKLRGYRIELAEIEAVLGQHPQIQESVVVLREDVPGEAQLVSYIVTRQRLPLPTEQVHEFLRRSLPEYMIPPVCIQLDALPLTANGKVDRQKLPLPEQQEADQEQARVSVPRGPIEEMLVEIWKDLLRLPRLGVHDHFFEVGGHSLLALQVLARVQAVLQVTFPVRTLFEAPTVARFAQRVEQALCQGTGTELPPLVAVTRPEEVPLSFAQQRLWFLDQLEPGSTAYLAVRALRLSGKLSTKALEQSLQELVCRHESLRTTFEIRTDHPVQVIHPVGVQATTRDQSFGYALLPVIDLQALGQERREEVARWLAKQEAQHPCDLATGPLLRTSLLRQDAEVHVLLLTLHHIITDGWSNMVLVRELTPLYRTKVECQPSPLAPLPIQYADYALWQRMWMIDRAGGLISSLSAQLVYWKKQLANLPRLELLTDYPRLTSQTYREATVSCELSEELSQGLVRLARKADVTLFMVGLAAFQVLLMRYTGQTDIHVGTPLANRTRAELEGVIGFFVNTLIVRTDLGCDPTFLEVLKQVREVCLQAYTHQDLPFEKLVEELQPERDLSRTPLSQISFDLAHETDFTSLLPGLSTEFFRSDGASADYDLRVTMREAVPRFSCTVFYNANLFEAQTLHRFLEHFQALLQGIVLTPEMPVARLPLLTESEREQLLVQWNATQCDVPQERCLHQFFEQQVERTPEAIAVVFEDQMLTYDLLNRRSNQLARHLQTLGVGPEVLVGVCMERTIEMVVGLLGILKTGGASVPLDPTHPQERLADLIADAQVTLLLTQEHLHTQLPVIDAPILCLETNWLPMVEQSQENLPWSAEAENLAYVIYTSGSTGGPKGVGVSQGAFFNLLLWFCQDIGLTALDRVLLVTSLGFDSSQKNIFAPLMVGGALHLPPLPYYDSNAIAQAIFLQSITVVNCTPSTFYPLVEGSSEEPYASLQSLRCLLLGGEALAIQRFWSWITSPFCQAQIFNVYGLTECSDITTSYLVLPSQQSAETAVPLGRPIRNAEVFLLDKDLQFVPVGRPGELYIGGTGLARGYSKRPELTAERFLPNPFATVLGERLYRTGDLARYRPDGTIEYLGRMDSQVKIRGVRIELGEIEERLRQHPAVREAVAIVRKDRPDDARLVAYVVLDLLGVSAISQEAQTRLAAEQLKQWQHLYDETYAQKAPQTDPTLNFVGWNSSYTGQPIGEEEMQAWLEDTLDLVRTYRPERLLEIGCGTGLLLFRLAPVCKHYYGTDFSAAALEEIRKLLAQREVETGTPARVTLLQRPADDFGGLPEGQVDTVLLNSVIQYFPDVNYLLRVLEGALHVVAPGGRILVGDVRSFPLLEAFHASVQFSHGPETLNRQHFWQQVQQRVQREKELVLDPAFFRRWAQTTGQVRRVEVRLKRARQQNELTQFRYQVVLHVGKPVSSEKVEQWRRAEERLNWSEQAMTEERFYKELERGHPKRLRLLQVPNARVDQAVQLMRWLKDESGPRSVEQWQAEQGTRALRGVEPEELREQAERLGYRVTINWGEHGPDGSYTVLLERQDSEQWGDPEEELVQQAKHEEAGGDGGEAISYQRYANQPLRREIERLLMPQVRRSLQEQLPASMVPTSFVVLSALPLTHNGKVDRRALPAPDEAGGGDEMVVGEPSTPIEELVVGIWNSVLGRTEIGIHDNFFALGGHSLLAVRLIARMRATLKVEIPMRVIFETPTVAGLARRVERELRKSEGIEILPLMPQPRPEAIPLSFAQERLWFLDQLYPASTNYLSSVALRMLSALNVKALECSLEKLVHRHEILRTTFVMRDDHPSQVIHPPPSYVLPLIDLQGLEQEARREIAQVLVRQEAQRACNLATGPLLRTSLLRLEEREHLWLLTLHHIITDGWSNRVLMSELAALYQAHVSRRPSPLSPLALQYADYALWQRQFLQGAVEEAQLAYWKKQLADLVPLQLPVERSGGPSQQAGTQVFALSPALSQTLAELSFQEHASIFMTGLSAFQTLLSYWCGQEEIVVGTDVANRDRFETERLIGFFVNQLVLRSRVRGNQTFRELLREVRQMMLDAYVHQDLPFEKLVEALRPQRSREMSPFFQVKFLVDQPAKAPTPDEFVVPELVVSEAQLFTGTTQIDLLLRLSPTPEGFRGRLIYRTDLFDAATMETLVQQFLHLLREIGNDPDARIRTLIELITEQLEEQNLEKLEKQAKSALTKMKQIRPKLVSL